jgi:hypothetical protein
MTGQTGRNGELGGIPQGQPNAGHLTGETNPLTAGGRRCRSEAYERADAEEFCRRELQCTSGMTCQGEARRWICWCK